MANINSLALVAASSQTASAADSASLSVTGSLTLEGWFKFNSFPSSTNAYGLLWKGSIGGATRSYFLRLFNNSGTYQLNGFYSTDGSYQATNDSSVNWTPSTGVWYHLALVIDVSAPNAKFYVNGVQQGATQTTTGGSINDSVSSFYIGAQDSGTPGAFFDGKVDDVRVYNTARSAGSILGDYQQELVGNESNLQAYWKLNNAYTDSTSNSNTLTSSGAPSFSTDVPFGSSTTGGAFLMNFM